MNFAEVRSIRAKYLNPDPLSLTFQPCTKELLPFIPNCKSFWPRGKSYVPFFKNAKAMYLENQNNLQFKMDRAINSPLLSP